MMQRIFRKRWVIALSAGLFVSMLAFTQPAQAANPAYGSCQTVQLAVAMHEGTAKNQQISGEYCVPHVWAGGAHQLDVLTAGATYNHHYWDWPQQSGAYSYADKTLRAGRAVFAYDNLGAGESSKPFGLTNDITVGAYVLHQIIQHFRTVGYTQINSIGHSMGSGIAIQNAATYTNDPNRLVITGILHFPAIGSGAAHFFTNLVPAPLDPQFAGKINDLTYLTTAPGSRYGSFYSSTADPAVVAYDEAHKDTVTVGQVQELLLKTEIPPPLNVANQITTPTLVMVGRQDALFCGLIGSCATDGAIYANESRYYSSVASLTVRGVDNTGHSLTLHPSANTSFTMIDQWLRTH